MENELAELTRRLSRDTTVLKTKIDETISLKKDMQSIITELQNEASEFKNCRSDIETAISDTTKESFPDLVNIISESIDKSLAVIVKSELSKFSESVESFGDHLKTCSAELKSNNNHYRKKLSRVGIIICSTFCLSSILTGFGLWYFFPQSQTIAFTPDQRQAMEYGTLLKFALPKLSDKDRQIIIDKMGDSWKDYYKELLPELHRDMKKK